MNRTHTFIADGDTDIVAGMISTFTFLVWLPMVISKPGDRGAWTGFFISWIIGAAAWVVAQQQSTAQREESAPQPVAKALART